MVVLVTVSGVLAIVNEVMVGGVLEDEEDLVVVNKDHLDREVLEDEEVLEVVDREENLAGDVNFHSSFSQILEFLQMSFFALILGATWMLQEYF